MIGPDEAPANRRIVLALGVPRSGTTALFDSLAGDPDVVPHHEPPAEPDGGDEPADPVYRAERLRPEVEIRPFLRGASGPVLLRPLNEVLDRTLDDVFAEYAAYDLRVVWIYRDPVTTAASAITKFGWDDRGPMIDWIVDDWNRRSVAPLRASHPEVHIVRYEDLAADPGLVDELGARVGLRPRSTFSADLARSVDRLAPEVRDRIRAGTAEVLARLHDRRCLRPRPGASPRRPEPTPRPGAVPDLGPLRDLEPAPPLGPGSVAGLRAWSAGPGEPVVRADGSGPVGPDDDWAFLVGGDSTVLAVLELPGAGHHPWSPVVTVGAPHLGRAGWTLAWLGTDSDERPSAAADGSVPLRPPGTSLLLAGVTGPLRTAPTTAAQVPLVARVIAGGAGTRSVVVIHVRRDGPATTLTLTTATDAASVTGPSLPPPPTLVDGLTLGSGPGTDLSFGGTIAELQIYDRALSPAAQASLLADLAHRHPGLGVRGSGSTAP